MAECSIFQIIEHRGERGFYPLNENHWSNTLAWLLDPRPENVIGRPLLEWLSPGWNVSNWKVEREIEYVVGSRSRLIDIQVTSDQGLRLIIEVKIDPTYQDREQIIDQLSVLSANEHFVIVSPLDLSSLLADVTTHCGSSPSAHAVTWRSVSKWCSEQRDTRENLDPLTNLLLYGIEGYWRNFVTTPFEQMVQTIISEQGWTSFFPDDFKEVFLQRFPEVWATWLAEKSATGRGNAHQYLTTCLSMLANRKNGFRLVKTGSSRAPNQPDWGFPTIFEMAVVTAQQQTSEEKVHC